MIRKLLSEDIDRVADIWLKTNLKAYYFISNQYWKDVYKRQMPSFAETNNTAPSNTDKERYTSAKKSIWPGVSIMLTFTSVSYTHLFRSMR